MDGWIPVPMDERDKCMVEQIRYKVIFTKKATETGMRQANDTPPPTDFYYIQGANPMWHSSII